MISEVTYIFILFSYILGTITVMFWLWFSISGIRTRKRKLPYVWGLYFLISYIFFFDKKFIFTDTATVRTYIIIGILTLLMLWGIYRWWYGKMSRETIERSLSINALDNLSRVKGEGFIKIKRNNIIFISDIRKKII